MAQRLLPLLVICSITAAQPAFAETKNIPINAFDQLTLSRGIQVTVSCGQQAQLEVSGEQLDIFSVTQEKSSLKLKYGRSFFSSKTGDGITVHLTTANPITVITQKTGTSLTLPSCAVANSLKANLANETTSQISGELQSLTLDANAGVVFNQDNDNLIVQNASVNISTNSLVNLCGAKNVSGSITTGSKLLTTRTTKLEVRKNSGGKVRFKC